jgi:hypothetical protein
MSEVFVNSVNAITDAINNLRITIDEVNEKTDEVVNHYENKLSQTQAEEQKSLGFLNVAKGIEATAIAEEVAAAAEVAACSVPPCIGLPAALAWLSQAEEHRKLAQQHREMLEHRCEMARQCVRMAEVLLEEIKIESGARKIKIVETSIRGIERLTSAREAIIKYLGETPPVVNSSGIAHENHNMPSSAAITSKTRYKDFEEWKERQPEKDKPVRPIEIIERFRELRDNDKIMLGMLTYTAATDEKFRISILKYREELKENADSVRLKIRKNMAGRLGEEIVKYAFKPYAQNISTQNRTQVDEAHYTKTDIIVKHVVVPIIFGKGCGVKVDQSVGIEVKTGQPAYLRSQLSHMLTQAIGHSGCEVSFVICSRDIHSGAEDLLREEMGGVGTRIFALLPTKEELDDICSDFVFGGCADE